MKYVNAHCHLASGVLPSDIAVAITNAARVSDWDDVIKISKNRGVYGAIGVHPWYISGLPSDWALRMRELLTAYPDLMVGEIGLDKNYPDMSGQIDVFRTQLKTACDMGRTVHIHCVGAWDKLLGVISEYTPSAIVLHDFAASLEIASVLEKYNSYFSFGRAICRPTCTRAVNALCHVSRNRILSESDTAIPLDVIMVVEKMANILNVSVADVVNTVYNNVIGLLKK